VKVSKKCRKWFKRTFFIFTGSKTLLSTSSKINIKNIIRFYFHIPFALAETANFPAPIRIFVRHHDTLVLDSNHGKRNFKQLDPPAFSRNLTFALFTIRKKSP